MSKPFSVPYKSSYTIQKGSIAQQIYQTQLKLDIQTH